jgi:Domain of unknown function (DUF4115)
VLADVIIIVVVVSSLVGVVLLRRRSHDDVHTIEGYHRVAHTLEVINEHPQGINEHPQGAKKSADPVVAPKHSYPESAVRLTDAATVRLTHPTPTDVPPIAPPEVTERVGAITFDDALAPAKGETALKPDDPAIGSMNHRPRRLLAPGLAVVGVLALVSVLLVYGAHSTKPPKHHAAAATTTSTSVAARPTTTTTLPAVSPPQVTSATDATYAVGKSAYTLVLTATSSQCWVSVTGAAGASIFSGVLNAGQQQSIPATGLVSVEVGAPGAFSATVNGMAVTLPTNYQTPLTLHFTPPASATN